MHENKPPVITDVKAHFIRTNFGGGHGRFDMHG
jgi:hypothetical protein